ncbi:hypothetical protein EW146_g406 [Bondarzewia mesenterica]|uniref:AAA+ ATPase domain-containing protein n=1 Tax=Bondarzewia mesenterica TaxID=1095465 RepID=A0A4S4M744_9AGAM|nr:hypothetical protein EW146_g406 [Bondarzewia mesenterica]
MPSLVLTTNVKVADPKAFALEFSKAGAKILGKPEAYISVSYHYEEILTFNGTFDPALLLNIISLDNISPEKNEVYSKALFEFFEKHLGVSSDRGYITFIDPGRAFLGLAMRKAAHNLSVSFKKRLGRSPDPSPRIGTPDCSQDVITQSSIQLCSPIVMKPDGSRILIKMNNAVQGAMDAMSQMNSTPGAIGGLTSAVDGTSPVVGGVTTAINTWEPLLDKLKVFTSLVDEVAEVHPYAKIAWSVLSGAYKIVLAQKDRDENIETLLKTMNDMYEFVNSNEVRSLSRIQAHKQVLARMAQQTTDCGYYICSYAREKNFWFRAGKHILSGVDATIKQYQDTFGQLMAEFRGQAVVQTEVTVLRILGDIESLATDADLNDMPYAYGARFNREKECLAGTREEILDEITEWINSAEDTRRVFLLTGAAGTGKSAIAHTIASRFHELRRLGSSFCFDRTYQAERRPDNLFSTVARDLASRDLHFKRALWQVVHDDKSLRTTRDVTTQLENFILRPAAQLAMAGPLVIVIDALDESGDHSSLRVLFSLLTRKMAELPSNFRILLTSRPLIDIEDLSFGNDSIVLKRMETISHSSTNHDILLYIRAQLTDIDRRLNFFDDAKCRLLAHKSEGLFQWAFTACEAIKGQGKGGSSPIERFKRLASATPRRSGMAPLDHLYSEILSQLFDVDDVVVMARFESVMGQVMTAFEPLSIDTLNALRQDRTPVIDEDDDLGDVDEVTIIVQFMGPLLSGVAQRSIPIRPLHSSFRDFLADASRSGPFFVNRSGHHLHLALNSFHVMKRGLQFNICHLESSYLFNRDVSDLVQRVRQCISVHLSYSCRFWANHLRATFFDSRLLGEIQDFLRVRFLFWLEALSLIRAVNLSWRALTCVTEWIRNLSNTHENLDFRDITNFVTDAQSFVRGFGSIISQSTPHLYLSALPFAPENSIISRHYLPGFSHMLSVCNGRTTDWPAIQNILKGHTWGVSSVAFSPDGKQIVSGSEDSTIRIWDAETGEAIRILEQHTGPVSSVIFSPDGKRILSGSYDSTIRVWDAETGDAMYASLQGHRLPVSCVAISPDGKRIASGSHDETIIVWNADTGEAVRAPLKGHTGLVASIAFSPNGKHIASCSYDSTVLLWDAYTGGIVHGPLKGHTLPVSSVAFSPDGRYIASGSHDETIRIWNAETGEAMRLPLKGHTRPISSVAFSADGKHIVSGSQDDTIRIWNAETGASVGAPLEGHGYSVLSVAYSPDSKRIASGSDDKTIRIWDAEKGGQAVPESTQVRSRSIYSVKFSADDKNIVLDAMDFTTYIWNAETGQTIRIVLGSSGPDPSPTMNSWNGESGPGAPSFVLRMNSRDGKRSVGVSDTDKRDMTLVNHRKRDMELNFVDLSSQEFITLKGHTGAVLSFGFSHDDKRIVSAAQDATVRVWDIEVVKTVREKAVGSQHAASSARIIAMAPIAFSSNPAHALTNADALFHQTDFEGDCDYRDVLRMDDGWIVGPQSRLLLWIPYEHRSRLWWPRYKLVIGIDLIQLDLSRFPHGSSWYHCRS